MSRIKVYKDSEPDAPHLDSSAAQVIQSVLAEQGVRFEQWPTLPALSAGSSPESVLSAYKESIDALCAAQGYQTVDVISLDASVAQLPSLRNKFLSEHTHAEDEVRFFVAGQGLFSLHIDHQVFEVLCQAGDLIGVPAGTPHWFDMGPKPAFTAIRFFNNPEGWVASYTGKSIAEKFSRLEY